MKSLIILIFGMAISANGLLVALNGYPEWLALSWLALGFGWITIAVFSFAMGL